MSKTQTRTLDPTSWVETHGDALFGYAMKHVRNVAAAEDLVQETFLAAMEASSAFEGRSSERTWLMGILRHKVIDHVRRVLRSGPSVEGDVPEALFESAFTSSGKWKRGSPARWGGDPEALVSEAEFQAVLAACLEKLPQRTMQAMLLLERQELKLAELSKLVGVTTTHLGVLLHRGRFALRQCLERNWFSRER